MISLGLTGDEFAARRRKAQTDIEALLRPIVEDAVDLTQDTSGWQILLDAVATVYADVLYEESGETAAPRADFLNDIETALRKTTAPRTEETVDRITVWLATAILSEATIEAANLDDEEVWLEWVDMGDRSVRPAHEKTSGQQRPVGVPFDVDGVEMPYPGYPGVVPELWMNCRCTLRPVLASEALVAGGDDMTETAVEPTEAPEDIGQVPWHGILAPEGVPSGDGRMFAAESLRNRDLPLPLTWQKASSDGHSGSVTVAKIEKIERVDGMMRASGFFLSSPEADEVMGLIAEFGKFGVSVDADDATMEIDEENELVLFTSARIASASIVAIPAFAEAFVALGYWDDEDKTEPVEVPAEAAVVSDNLAEFADLAPGKTEDGPGWLTHPVDTDRLRDYWVRGPGAAKIGWGTPGDFNRCRINVAEYVKPQYLNGYCANRHYDALGFWPGRGAHAADALEATSPGEALSLVAAVGHIAPAAWFKDPELTEPTPLTVTDDGRVFGHIAEWGVCHIGFQDQCITPPRNATGYAYFQTGQVALDDGSRANVGQISIGGGHADGRLGLRAALAHYDSTSTAAADVTVGEDEHGIWCAGWVRPGTSKDTATALMASTISGDWRRARGEMELVAALAVNVPGFGIPRTRIAASSEGQISLVASGVLPVAEINQVAPEHLESIVANLADAVAAALEDRAKRREKMAALAAKVNGGSN